MRKLCLFALTIGIQTAVVAAAARPLVTLWRLDCGHLGESMNPTSCYLVRHRNTYMLWDAGLNPELAHKGAQKDGPRILTLGESVPEQLGHLGLKPEDIPIVALSHVHYDHAEGAVSFPRATLLIGRADYETHIDDPSSLTSIPGTSPVGSHLGSVATHGRIWSTVIVTSLVMDRCSCSMPPAIHLVTIVWK